MAEEQTGTSLVIPGPIPGSDATVATREQADTPFLPYALAIASKEDSLGPKMKALRLRQRCFVLAMVSSCANNLAEAARMAGYTGNDATLQVTASRLRANPAIQEAVDEEARKVLTGGKMLAVKVIMDVMENPVGKADTKLRAAAMLLNRVGMAEEFNQKVTVEHKQSENDMVKEIRQMAERLGLDSVKLLGNAGIKVEDTPMSTEGLEEVL